MKINKVNAVVTGGGSGLGEGTAKSVSYTHLTLPTTDRV